MNVTTYVNYTCSNTSTQVIDTFDPPTERIISYKINVKPGNTTWYSTLDVSHNGINASEQQFALAQTGIIPTELVVTIANNSGSVSITPTVIPTVLSIERIATLCDRYSDNTLSGRNILTDEGLGIYFNSSNNITIRQANNNTFTYANAYVTSGVMGPIKEKEELLSTWTSSNGNIRILDGDYQVAISSGQKDNCQTQQISTSPGRRYILTGNAYYTTDQNFSVVLEDRDTGASRIEIGTSFGENDYGGYICTTTESSFSIPFKATSDVVDVSFGFGDINNRLYVKDFQLREYVPFYTYDQDQGSLYLKWNAVVAGNTILNLYSETANNRVYVDASNNIFVNSVNCGAQATTNKLTISYNENGIAASRNGNAIVSSIDTFNKYIVNAVFVSVPLEFAYMSNVISNTSMVTLSNV